MKPAFDFLTSFEPPWIVGLVASAIVGALFRELAGMIRGVVKRVWAHPLCGEWHAKHKTRTTNGEVKTNERIWSIKPIWYRGVLSITVRSGEKVVFKGRYTPHRGKFGLHLYREEEDGYFKLQQLFTDQDYVIGVWSGVDYGDRIISGPITLSRQPISDEEFAVVISRHFKCNAREFYLSVTNGQ